MTEEKDPLTDTLRDYLAGKEEIIGSHQESVKWLKNFDSDFQRCLAKEQAKSLDLPMIQNLIELAKKVEQCRKEFKTAVEVFETEVENARGLPEAQISYFVPKAKRAKTEASALSDSDGSDAALSGSDASDAALSDSDASD